MTKVIFNLIQGLNGQEIDTGDDRFDQGPLKRVSKTGQSKFAPGQSRGANAAGMHLSDKVTHAGTKGQASAGAAGNAVGVMFTASQTMNHHTANKAEDRALNALQPCILKLLPYNYGGVIVVSVFKIINSARMFRNSFVGAWAASPESGLKQFRDRGSISEIGTDTRIYFATLLGQKVNPKEIIKQESRMRLMR